MIEVAPRILPPLEVLIVGPPDQQDTLAAALLPSAFHSVFAPNGESPGRLPAVILFSPADSADLASLSHLAAGGVPVVVVLDASAALAEHALAAGASDYVYRLGNWLALLPFHLRRAVGAVPAGGGGQQQGLDQLAHDLRGPLTYLVGYSELLAMRELPPERVREMAQEMLREAEKLSQRLDDFLPPRTG